MAKVQRPSSEEFADILMELAEASGIQVILSTAGVYEVVAEAWNNDVLDRWAVKHGYANYKSYMVVEALMDREEILKQVMKAFGIAAWEMKFGDFIKAVDGGKDEWTEGKWTQFQLAAQNIGRFTPKTLYAILSPYWPENDDE